MSEKDIYENLLKEQGTKIRKLRSEKLKLIKERDNLKEIIEKMIRISVKNKYQEVLDTLK